MTVTADLDSRAAAIFATIPDLLAQRPALIGRGPQVDVECLLGPTGSPFHVSFRAGRIADLARAPVLMRSWRFAYLASSPAWINFWKPIPDPGWHDLFALAKRGEATLQGDIHPFMAHLQYFKDVLAPPRSRPESVS